MSNPHNPTGKQFDMTFINSISEKLNKIGSYFVIDEAYLDYGQPYEVPNTLMLFACVHFRKLLV